MSSGYLSATTSKRDKAIMIIAMAYGMTLILIMNLEVKSLPGVIFRVLRKQREMISEALNIDCMEYMSTVPDKFFDLAIVDPPYGINAPKMAMGGGL